VDLERLTAADVCPICGGIGWVLDSADGRKLAHPCVCRASEAARARLSAAGIPERYRDCTLDNFSDNHASLTRAKTLAREFVDAYPAVDADSFSWGRRAAARRISRARCCRSS